jgi:hypothetical protein
MEHHDLQNQIEASLLKENNQVVKEIRDHNQNQLLKVRSLQVELKAEIVKMEIKVLRKDNLIHRDLRVKRVLAGVEVKHLNLQKQEASKGIKKKRRNNELQVEIIVLRNSQQEKVVGNQLKEKEEIPSTLLKP